MDEHQYLLNVIASLGPRLVVDGTFTGVRMPWRVVEMLPGLSHALPGRFSAFAFMAICVLVAHAWSTRALTRPVVAVLVLAAVVSLVPDFAVMRVPARTADETFIATGACRQVISRNENVLVLPAGEWGPGMEWIEESDFWFRMPTGNGGGASLPPELQDPVGRALFLQDPAFDYTTTLKPYLRRYGIGAVLVPDDDARYVAIATAALGAPDREVDGVRVWENAGT